MSSSRRQFVSAGLASAAALALSRQGDTVQAAASETACLDYGRSFICNTAAFNAVRFWIESRTLVTDPAGKTTTFYQCASCKSEDTFAKENLFYPDNYDFLPILGDGQWLIFRRMARLNPNYRQVKKVDEMWGEPQIRAHAAGSTPLDTFEKIRDASAAAIPIVGRTEIQDADGQWKAVIEYPVKTLNVALERKMYQVDTGPIALPDFSGEQAPLIERLRLAFVAFNAPHFADFVIEQPTPVVEEGEEKCQIYHYSSPISLPAKNSLHALGAV